MSSLASPSPGTIRARRVASLTLSALTMIVAGAAIVVLALHPSVFLSDGTFGLGAVETAIVNALPFLPLAPMAALLLLIGMPKRTEAGPGPRTVPMRLALIALGLCLLCYIAPIVVMVASLFFGLLIHVGG